MKLLAVVCLGLCACAEGQRALPVPDGAPLGDLAAFIDRDSGTPDDAKADLRSGPDLTSFDLAGADLTGVCTGPVINEVQTGGAGGASDEWVELYNPCSQAVTLSGWTLKYRAATGVTDIAVASLTGSIPSHQWYLVANTAYSGSATPDIKPFTQGGLAATGGGVGLRDPSGALIDGVGWGNANNIFVETSAAVAPPTSRSIALHPNGNDTDNNSTDFMDSTPTPRASN